MEQKPFDIGNFIQQVLLQEYSPTCILSAETLLFTTKEIVAAFRQVLPIEEINEDFLTRVLLDKGFRFIETSEMNFKWMMEKNTNEEREKYR